MKISRLPLWLLCGFIPCALQAQITVKGVSSAPKSMRQPAAEMPGGPTAQSYEKIDDGAYGCIYLYRINTSTKEGEPVTEDYYCMLNLGPRASRFTDYTVFRADSAVLASQPDPKMRDRFNSGLDKQALRFYPDIIQGYPQGELTYTDLVTPDYLEYTEPLGSMQWEIGEETDTVCGYPCLRATASYGGRDWVAWFSEEIPSSAGPWKFNGLPGLILSVGDTEGIHSFTAVSFRQGDSPVAKPKNSMIQKTTRDKFVEVKPRFEKSPYKYIKPEAIKDIAVFPGGQVLINGVTLPRRPNGYVPVELR